MINVLTYKRLFCKIERVNVCYLLNSCRIIILNPDEFARTSLILSIYVRCNDVYNDYFIDVYVYMHRKTLVVRFIIQTRGRRRERRIHFV